MEGLKENNMDRPIVDCGNKLKAIYELDFKAQIRLAVFLIREGVTFDGVIMSDAGCDPELIEKFKDRYRVVKSVLDELNRGRLTGR